MPSDSPFADLPRVLALRRLVGELDPSGPPAQRIVVTPGAGLAGNVALLPGSFNPPTMAHLALAESALKTGKVDAVCFLLATRTVNKERVEGASLADRLLLLEEITRGHPKLGVVLVNRGLYVDQARIARAALPRLGELWFIVGFDKIVQIFDPRYYAHRDIALDELFRLARFFVAPRGAAGFDDLNQLLNEPQNRPYADRVTPLPLPPEYREVSSSHLRAVAHQTGPLTDVPPIVTRFIEATGAYEPPITDAGGPALDRYAEREARLAAAEMGQLSAKDSPEHP